jgi:hypothetical protein
MSNARTNGQPPQLNGRELRRGIRDGFYFRASGTTVIVTSFPSLSTTTSTGSPIFTAP